MSAAAGVRRTLLAPDPSVLALLLLGLGLAHREAFFTVPGAVLIVAGVALLAVAPVLSLRGRTVGGDGRDLGYLLVFVVFALVGGLAPFYPDPLANALTLAAPAAFILADAFPPTRRAGVWVAAALLIAAHAVVIVKVPAPQHQDVFRFLNLGSDAILHGRNPYAEINLPDATRFKFTYPPGVLVLVAPFRLLLGDIRWSYIAAEALVVTLLGLVMRRSQGAPTRAQAALLLLPLALPRVAQAFFIFSNHEWLLLALAAAILVMAPRRWALTGVLLGVGIASKQYFVLFPALFLAPVLTWRSVGLALLVAPALVLPFLVWGPGVFLSDVVGNLANAPDPERVTFWAIAYNAGLDLGRAGATALLVVGLGLTAALAWTSRGDLSRSLYACGLALALFTLCSPFAAYNYYVYAIAFVTWGLLLPGARAAAGKIPIGLVGFSSPVREEP